MRLPGFWRGGERLPFFPIRDDFGRLVDRLFAEMGGLGRGRVPEGGGEETSPAGRVFSPVVDVIDRDDRFIIRAELPGIDPENVSVDVVGDAIQIRGERSTEVEREEGDYYYCERGCGSFLRTVPLPQRIDPEKVEADFRNGVLEIQVPKSETARRRKIQVRGGEAGGERRRVDTGARGEKTGKPPEQAPRGREERGKTAPGA